MSNMSNQNMKNNILNYISIGIFFIIVLLMIFYKREPCKNFNNVDEKYNIEDEKFLEKEVYQNVPLLNYNYLQNYPNGPFSWGQWSWNNNSSKVCNSNYSNIFNKEDSIKNIEYTRNINTKIK